MKRPPLALMLPLSSHLAAAMPRPVELAANRLAVATDKDGDFTTGSRCRACRTWPEGRLPLGVGLRACREAQFQKSMAAGERDRPRGRAAASPVDKISSRVEAERLVFIDEIWTRADMARLRGWAPRGRRLHAKALHGRW
jgi:hypothetical protein